MGGRGEIMLLTDVGLACYDNRRWFGAGQYHRVVEVGHAIVVEQHVVLTNPHTPLIQGFDVEVEGEAGRSFVCVHLIFVCVHLIFVCVHLMAPTLRPQPFTPFLADILAPTFVMEHRKAFVVVQLGPTSLRLSRLEDMGIWRRGRKGIHVERHSSSFTPRSVSRSSHAD